MLATMRAAAPRRGTAGSPPEVGRAGSASGRARWGVPGPEPLEAEAGPGETGAESVTAGVWTSAVGGATGAATEATAGGGGGASTAGVPTGGAAAGRDGVVVASGSGAGW